MTRKLPRNRMRMLLGPSQVAVGDVIVLSADRVGESRSRGSLRIGVDHYGVALWQEQKGLQLIVGLC